MHRNDGHGFTRICTDRTKRISVEIRGALFLDSRFLDSRSLRPVEHFYLGRLSLRTPVQPVLISRAPKRAEQRMRLQRLRLELWMELAADEMRMVRQLHHLYVGSIRRGSRNLQSRRRHWLFILTIEFIAVPVALADFRLPVNAIGQRARLDLARPGAQPHRPAQFFHAAQLAQLIDHTGGGSRIELARIRFRESHYIPRKLDASRLHPQANPKVRNLFLPRVADRDQHAFDAALAKSTRNQDPVITLKLRLITFVAGFEALGLNPVQLQLQIV